MSDAKHRIETTVFYMAKEYKFKAEELESQITTLTQKGITELSVTDEKVSRDKNKLLRLMKLVAQHAPEVYVSFLAEAAVIDREVIAAASNLFCSFDIPLVCTQKGGHLLFDKKFYANKARLLNEAGLVFGFQLTYATVPGDSQKLFMERLDFAVQQYPNHIDFPQTESEEYEAKVSGTFSAADIRYCRDTAFACRTFYTSGRAVPWFLSVLKPLRIYPSRFFSDFAEWQRVNNCSYKSGFVPEGENHKSIEKMQLLFLDEKYEEKHCHNLITLVHDIVGINGAMSRLAGENEESTIETSYHPDDLLGPEALDLTAFAEDVCMEHCTVKIFSNGEYPDYEVK
ncbi:hypothetical protein SAMN04487775_11111 [Treponema bryantii]|uniref:Uncharacterized protein n=1 Tax=Treponema bryantii TaxID=163 RepID=A0A1I3MX03_9SPIR|nr:hypothetical protein [Treponema bryantii]SFJ01285.1 hypothetical protein SAMN04487775_11111 [Treponema bryantii]